MRELIDRAIVGTGQNSVPISSSFDPVDALVRQIENTGPERALLLTAGTAAIYARAGRLLPAMETPAAPASPETLRPCGDRLRSRVVGMVNGEFAEVLPEALRLLSNAQRRLPHDALPEVMDKVPPAQRGLARSVLGERARWLAGIKPEWAWVTEQVSGVALPANADGRWSEGTSTERQSLLQLARRVDPDRARQWMAATWKQDSADQRALFLTAMEAYLGAADEPFLTQALTDRSAKNRVAAARMMWRLRDSALARGVLGRADSMLAELKRPTGLMAKLKATVGGASKATLVVNLPPENYESAWEREGITEQPPGQYGRRQWWLAQTIASVPPSHWEERFNATPAEIIAALQDHEYAHSILDGLTYAALTHNAQPWLEPLWSACLATAYKSGLVAEPLKAILLKLRREAAERCVLALLQSHAPDVSVLQSLPGPWTERVADVLTSEFPGVTASASQALHPWLNVLPAAGLAFPPSRLDRSLPEQPPSETPDWKSQETARQLERFHATLRFRAALYEEIQLEQRS